MCLQYSHISLRNSPKPNFHFPISPQTLDTKKNINKSQGCVNTSQAEIPTYSLTTQESFRRLFPPRCHTCISGWEILHQNTRSQALTTFSVTTYNLIYFQKTLPSSISNLCQDLNSPIHKPLYSTMTCLLRPLSDWIKQPLHQTKQWHMLCNHESDTCSLSRTVWHGLLEQLFLA